MQIEFASGGNWGSRSVFLQQTGEFSESGEVPQIPMTFLQFLGESYKMGNLLGKKTKNYL